MLLAAAVAAAGAADPDQRGLIFQDDEGNLHINSSRAAAGTSVYIDGQPVVALLDRLHQPARPQAQLWPSQLFFAYHGSPPTPTTALGRYSWAYGIPLLETPLVAGNAAGSIAVAHNGTVLLSLQGYFNHDGAAADDSLYPHMVLFVSTDNGTSWPSPSTMPPGSVTVPNTRVCQFHGLAQNAGVGYVSVGSFPVAAGDVVRVRAFASFGAKTVGAVTGFTASIMGQMEFQPLDVDHPGVHPDQLQVCAAACTC